MKWSYISPAIFILTLLCFFLPWINLSCQGQKIVSMSGFQLSTGTTFQQPRIFGQTMPQIQGRESRKIRGEPVAIITLIITVLGIIAGSLKGKMAHVASAAAGGLGAILLVILRYRISNEASKIAVIIQIDYGIGYYLAFLFFIAALGYNLLLLKGSPLFTAGPSPAPSSAKFCTQCGASNPRDNAFCNICGARF